MVHDFLGRFIGKFPWTTEHLYRKSNFSEQNVPIRNSCSISWKPSVWYLFIFPPFFGNWNWFVKRVSVIPGRNLPVPEPMPLTPPIRRSAKNASSQVMTRPVCPCKCLKTNAILVRKSLNAFSNRKFGVFHFLKSIFDKRDSKTKFTGPWTDRSVPM